MATPALSASTRFFGPATTKCYYVPTIALANHTPTRAELNAGTDLSGEVGDFSGWTVMSDQIETPDYATLFTSKIGGRTNSPDSQITFYASSNGTDIRALLPRGTSGYIAWMDGGDTAGNKIAVYPIKVISCSQLRATDKDADRVKVEFSITSQPGEHLTCPS
jgi:hypothetical protein